MNTILASNNKNTAGGSGVVLIEVRTRSYDHDFYTRIIETIRPTDCFHGQLSPRLLNQELLPISEQQQQKLQPPHRSVYSDTSTGAGFSLRSSPDQ